MSPWSRPLLRRDDAQAAPPDLLAEQLLAGHSYYFDKNGDVPLRPATTWHAYWRSRCFPLDDYAFTPQVRV